MVHISELMSDWRAQLKCNYKMKKSIIIYILNYILQQRINAKDCTLLSQFDTVYIYNCVHMIV